MLRITGFPTTPGPTEPALTTDKNFINADVVMICRLKERITKLNEIASSLPDKKFAKKDFLVKVSLSLKTRGRMSKQISTWLYTDR